MKIQLIKQDNVNKLTKILTFFGVLFIFVFVVIYYYGYKNHVGSNGLELLGWYTLMAVSSELIVLCILFSVICLDFKQRIVQAVGFILVGLIIGIIIYEESVRLAFMLLICVVVISVFISLILKVYATVGTFSICSIPAVIIAGFFIWIYPMFVTSIIYIVFTIFIVFYTMAGVSINQFILRLLVGESVASEYSKSILRMHMNLIYVSIFIAINITGVIYGENLSIYNLINNCFLTAFIINQIDYRKLIESQFFGVKLYSPACQKDIKSDTQQSVKDDG